MKAADKLRRADSMTGAPLRTLALLTLVVAIFHFAREVLLPFALAVLLSFLLAPLARLLEWLKLGRIPSVMLTVAIAFGVMGGIGWIVTQQAIDMATQLPSYEQTLVTKIRTLRQSGSSTLDQAAETVEKIEKEIVAEHQDQKTDDDPEAVDQPGRVAAPALPAVEQQAAAEEQRGRSLRAALFGRDPLPVRIVDTTFLPLRVLRDIVPLLAPLGSATIVVIFVIFMLLKREDLRDRLIRLAGTSRVYVTTQALDDAAKRLSRYLLMQLMINVIYGISIGFGLWLIGLPNALLWGLLATVLRFLPYVGPIIAALTPIALSFAVFDGWMLPLTTIALFVTAELITNNLLEPWLYGSSTGVSTIGIVASVVFWTWVWGPVGLVLATPLTVCLTVMSRHIPQLNFLNILLADEPPLELRFRFYQRLLAGDDDEAAEVAGEFLRNGTLDELYDTMLIPALILAERDRDAGRLTDVQEDFVYESISLLVEELEEGFRVGHLDESLEEAAEKNLDLTPAEAPYVLCLPAEDEADRIAAVMLSQLLEARGYRSDVGPLGGATAETLKYIGERDVSCVVISTVAPGRGWLRTRNACKRVARRYRDITIVVGVWHKTSELERARGRLSEVGADTMVVTLAEGIDEVQRLVPIAPTGKSVEEDEAAAESAATGPD